MREATDLKILDIIVVPAERLDLGKAEIGKTILLDITNAEISRMEVKAKLLSHLPLGAKAALSPDEIHNMYFDAANWPANGGITSPHNQPAKRTPLDIDFMADNTDSDKKFVSHVVLRLNDRNTDVAFSTDVHRATGMPLVVTQSANDPNKVGRVAQAAQFIFGGFHYAHFFITRGVDPSLINYAVALDYRQPSGNVVPVVIDPGSQNQRP
ncbi:MAG: hypothetical protein IBJ12_02165 [Sphingomonadaceae bacterium]|nr:hypothetical protein [Sphingomonadaceae bacterium]